MLEGRVHVTMSPRSQDGVGHLGVELQQSYLSHWHVSHTVPVSLKKDNIINISIHTHI